MPGFFPCGLDAKIKKTGFGTYPDTFSWQGARCTGIVSCIFPMAGSCRPGSGFFQDLKVPVRSLPLLRSVPLV